jgi:hypothetical protein
MLSPSLADQFFRLPVNFPPFLDQCVLNFVRSFVSLGAKVPMDTSPYEIFFIKNGLSSCEAIKWI